MAESSEALGGWEEDRDQLQKTQLDGAGLYANQPGEVTFRALAIRLISREIDTAGDAWKEPAYLLLGDRESFAFARGEGQSVPMLRSGHARLGGHVWLTPRDLGHGLRVPVHGLPPDEAFEKIRQLGAGSRPLVAYVPMPVGGRVVYFYPGGVDKPEEPELTDIDNQTVDPVEIDSALLGLHKLIRTPDQSESHPLWIKPEKWWPIKLAEKAIEHEVTRALAGKFWYLDVRSEQPSSVGRTDVELIETQALPAGINIRHALIELKVFRSFGSTGRSVKDAINNRQLREGIRQADQYGQANNSKIKMLCCYDMRTADSGDAACFGPYAAAANARDVRLKRYFLYNSSDALRLALDAQAAAACRISPLPK